MIPKGLFEKGLETLAATGEAVVGAHRERVVWRHQLVGDPNPLAENAAGIDPRGFRWRTRDFAPWASPQGADQRGLKTFYLWGGVPTSGDLLVTLSGRPQTLDATLRAPRTGYWRVKKVDARRSPSGALVYCEVKAAPDHSGQWGEHQFDPAPL